MEAEGREAAGVSTADSRPPDTEVEESNENGEKDNGVAAHDILYCIESFYAIVKPVLLTMVLAALAVVFINTPALQEAGQASISSSYNVYGDASNSDSTGRQLSAGLINALVIVSVICVMTFFIVILYKYKCMKVLLGYMVLSSAMLLGYLSSVMFDVAVQVYGLTIDKISFWLTIYNFAVVGCASIFYQDGFPPIVAQGYLIASSVIVAWQLSFFDPWTAWALLVLLALYDLFAVLSPCGPLKALINLMQREGAPEMPGLLYEAALPLEAKRPRPAASAQSDNDGQRDNSTASNTAPVEVRASLGHRTSLLPSPASSTTKARRNLSTISTQTSATTPIEESTMSMASNRRLSLPEVDPLQQRVVVGFDVVCGDQADSSSSAYESDGTTPTVEGTEVCLPPAQLEGSSKPPAAPSAIEMTVRNSLESRTSPEACRTVTVPLAIAKRYKLPLVDNPTPRWLVPRNEEEEEEPYSAEELRSMVVVVLPLGGGRIERKAEQRDGQETRYDVIDRHGNHRRTLFVNVEGKLFEDLGAKESDTSPMDRNSIRLGLGDFIFYSILVAEAAVYSFTTFAACVLAILTGLGATMGLLAVCKKALPALPISIFLGVIFYLVTRYAIEPWVKDIFISQCYV